MKRTNRFSNKKILVDSKQPIPHTQIYTSKDLNKLDVINAALNESHFSPTSKTEYHIYSDENLAGSSEYPLDYSYNGEFVKYQYTINITPEKDVRSIGIESGTYNIVYNFLDTILSGLNIDNISVDGTEIQLSIGNTSDSNKLKKLYDYVNKSSNTKSEFVLNFGENDLIPIVGVYFDNNARVGETVVNLPFPTTTFNNQPTIFYPLDNGTWVEVYRPNLLKANVQFSDSYKIIQTDLAFITTGRTAFFETTVNENKIGWQQSIDGNGDLIYFTHDATVADRLSTIQPNINLTSDLIGRPTHATVRYYDNSLLNTNSLTNVVLKLYNPIPSELFDESPSIDLVLRESYIERILVYPAVVESNQEDFSPPDFSLDLGYYGKSQGTSLKNWNDLLDTNQITANQIIDTNFSSSFGNLKLNIDYTDFSNFVKYSSAVERVHNFRYKLQLIENYNSRISTLQQVSGSNAITNISQSISRRDSLIGTLDGWERWMYYDETGSLYTHYSSSVFTYDPWPKKPSDPKVLPLALYETTSSIAENYFYGLIESASYYDSINDSMLTKITPVSIVEDDLNQDYLLFLNMIGQYFDNIWTYVKSLTSINLREEHPFDGMPDELLYNVASSLGWNLTHSKQRSELWRYFIGTDKLGNPIQSGSLQSKSETKLNSEVWRRIVNNIPYLLKTKGSRRSVKALISMYGIPQSFLSIREYGGPEIDETDAQLYWEHDKFVYHLNFDGDNYITTPWDDVATFNGNDYSFNEYKVPDSIELQFQQNIKDTVSLLNKDSQFAVILEETASSSTYGNIHFYLSGSSGYKSASIENVPLFDRQMSTLIIQRNVSTGSISTDNSYTLIYKRSNRDRLLVDKSATLFISGSTESTYNAAWTSSAELYIGYGNLETVGTPSIWASAGYLNGAIQEIRLWENALGDTIISDHTLARNMYNGNTHTSSFFDLKFRFIPDSQLKTISGNIGVASQHPNQQISTTLNGSIISASLFNFESDDLLGITEEYYTRIPSAGANNIMTNKVRIDDNELIKPLDISTYSELSLYDMAPVDTNQVGVYLSATQPYEEDIYNHTGFFKIDDYIGSPDTRKGFSETYRELDYLRRQVFKKYSTKNLINSIIDILARYDLSVFEQIRQTMPARVDYNSGILIEPHILERPKFKSNSNISYDNLVHEVNIKQIDKVIDTEFIKLDSTIDVDYNVISDFSRFETNIKAYNIDNFQSSVLDVINFGEIDVVTPYDMATYFYTNLIYSQSADVGFGINWSTSSNGYWNYTPIGTVITSSRESQYAKSQVFFYSSDISASLNVSFSSSLKPSQVSTDLLPLGYATSKYIGCKMTSDSITTNSPDTPDGRPVIEVFDADPNVLIYTTQTAEDGNLDVVAGTNTTTLDLSELFVYKHIEFENYKNYQKEVSMFKSSLSKLKSLETARISEFDLMVESQLSRETDDVKIRTSVDYFINE